MLKINMDDVWSILNTCKPYLIALGAVAIIALIVIVAVRKLKVENRKLIRSEAGIALLCAVIIIVNLICSGPMSTLISLATGNGTISDETSAEATQLSQEIAGEGIVLLKNDNNILPITDNKNLNVFGWASTNPCYGGTGSGSLSDAYETVSLLQGLEDAGFSLNSDLSDFYTAYRSDRPEVGMWAQDWTLPEPTADSYTDELINDAKNFSDTALVVITRVGGEGADLPTDVSTVTYTDNSTEYKDFEDGEHYLQLSQTEKDMVELVCNNFNNVLVVYNGANTMELGFVNDYEQIQGVIWCPGTGQSGFEALGEIIAGEINPSGKTSDTFVKDLTTTPTWNNFGDFEYDNMEEFEHTQTNFTSTTESYGPHFVNYVENIYVGYRFYETAATEGLINYDDMVMYPFGYGLSYTSFTQEMGAITETDDTISFDVTVTNTGDVAGKDVIEVYYNPPYTNGGIEKATANLIKFEKTEELQPGDSQTINITFNKEDMSSYDSYNAAAYVLEAGDYGISIRENSHNIIDEQIVSISETIVYDENNKSSTDESVATNQFEDAEGEVTYLSRANGFANYAEATAAPKTMSMPEEQKSTFVVDTVNYNPEDYNDESDEMPTTGAKNGLELADLRGLDYDDPQWDKLLDQLTVAEMDNLIALGGYTTASIPSVNKVMTVDCDGPASINNNFTGTGSIGFPSAVMIANTWNKDVALAFGESIGKMADEMDVSGWYAPAMNIHRSAFSGRNFEYYSEDGVLSGYMAANAVIGAEEYGVYAYIKHFALNDQETNRTEMLCTWATEQAIREINLKPFEIAVKEGGAKAVMSAFNYIGTTYAGGNNALLNNVLRGEWGFQGMVLTDYFGGYGYMDSDICIRNGNDFCLVAYDMESNHLTDKTSATSVIAMRQAAKNIMYTVVNSRAYDEANLQTGLMPWQITMIVIDVILVAGVIVLEVVTIKKYRERKVNYIEV